MRTVRKSPSAKKGQKPVRADWKVELIRFTAFLPTTPDEVQSWWSKTVGQPPETTLSNVREAKQRFEAPIGSGRLVLQTELNRVDWVLLAQINFDREIVEPPNLGGLSEVMETFTSFVERWLTLKVPAIRLAVGVTLVQEVRDRTAGYRRLKDFLKDLKIDPERTSDLVYQINKPITSRVVSGISINRLQKWSVAQFRHLSVKVQELTVPSVSSPAWFACRCELDMNTPAERNEIIPEDQAALFKELCKAAVAIAKKGDSA
jgi:hypothetical protein